MIIWNFIFWKENVIYNHGWKPLLRKSFCVEESVWGRRSCCWKMKKKSFWSNKTTAHRQAASSSPAHLQRMQNVAQLSQNGDVVGAALMKRDESSFPAFLVVIFSLINAYFTFTVNCTVVSALCRNVVSRTQKVCSPKLQRSIHAGTKFWSCHFLKKFF